VKRNRKSQIKNKESGSIAKLSLKEKNSMYYK
jgi:hypothetical protein